MEEDTLDRLRSKVLEAARATDRRRGRRHRLVAVLATLAAAGLITAGALALSAPPPPPPLPPDEEYSLYLSSIEAEWDFILEDFPEAVKPDVSFEHFVTDDEYDGVMLECLNGQGVPAELGEHGVSVHMPSGTEETYRVAWYACNVRFPLSPNESLPYTEDELQYIYRYWVEQLTPCLVAEGYDIGAAPTYSEFRARWWTDDTWSPYLDVVESDGDAFRELEMTCPPMPSDLRP